MAVEKAQDVLNDQYTTLSDFQLQVNELLNGVRILNERVEDYDKRLEAIQSANGKFFEEVTAENLRQRNVICQAFDTMYEKISSDIAAKVDVPLTPTSSTNISSPRIDSRNGLQLPNNALTMPNVASNQAASLQYIGSTLDAHLKMINETTRQLQQLQGMFSSVGQIPQQVQRYCDGVSQRLSEHQVNQQKFQQDLTAIGGRLIQVEQNLSQNARVTESRFADTAIHMSSVKKRFGEHRKQLDNLIMAWKETVQTLDDVRGSYQSVQEFLEKQFMPVLGVVRQQFPDLLESSTARLNTLGGQRTGPSK